MADSWYMGAKFVNEIYEYVIMMLVLSVELVKYLVLSVGCKK
jgi:hypothetical protein